MPLGRNAAVSAIALVALVSGCGDPAPSSSTPDAGGADVDAGGLVVTSDGADVAIAVTGGDAALSVPAGAVPEDLEIAITLVDPTAVAPLPGSATMPLPPVAFTPHGTTFSVPVTVAFTVDAGLDPSAVIVRLDDEQDTTWEVLPSSIVGATIQVEVTHFSIYAISEGCPPDDPDSDGDGACDSADPCVAPSDDTDGNGVCDDAEARIVGVVTEGGQPVADVAVRFYDGQQVDQGSVTTDATGAYSLGGLSAGTYYGYVNDNARCLYGYGTGTVALGEVLTIDIATGCN